MLIRHHKPLGKPEEAQDPLPKDWKVETSKDGNRPRRFGVVEENKLYRSGIVWSHQVRELQKDYGIVHIISLLDGEWLREFYDTPEITIHQFPILQRRELTYERVRNIVDVINDLNEPSLVHCLTGATRTGMVCAGYQIINGRKGTFGAIVESIGYGMVNISSLREMLHYHR
ncbi:hypothetical protein HYW99_03390 [Candidatus Woesearchaeota archaeon]|nr:hypothetical protein [Candidatus Woesearchaeota archaeon]